MQRGAAASEHDPEKLQTFRTRSCCKTRSPSRIIDSNSSCSGKSRKEPDMLDQIQGLHHVTSMAKDARENNDFFTHKLGLRRVKKTVNFDAPDVYHLYYGDEVGTPGTVMTYFPFPDIGAGRPGTGEVGTTVFAVPRGALGYWKDRLTQNGATGLKE